MYRSHDPQLMSEQSSLKNDQTKMPRDGGTSLTRSGVALHWHHSQLVSSQQQLNSIGVGIPPIMKMLLITCFHDASENKRISTHLGISPIAHNYKMHDRGESKTSLRGRSANQSLLFLRNSSINRKGERAVSWLTSRKICLDSFKDLIPINNARLLLHWPSST